MAEIDKRRLETIERQVGRWEIGGETEQDMRQCMVI